MKSFAVIGHPLGHSLGPTLHNHIFDRLSLAARYHALDTPPGGLPEVVRQLREGRLAGINVTLPHKTALPAYLDAVAPDAVPVGAVNCVAVEQGRLVGHNTDVTGIRAALRQGGVKAGGRGALILGAGGAARAAVVVLLQLGTDRICVAGRREAAARDLLEDFRATAGSTLLESGHIGPALDTAPYPLLINATPVGMWPRITATPLQADQLHRGQTVFDLVYHPENTLLLRRALKRGCRIVTGLDMFIAQALASLEHWLPGVIYNEAGRLNPKIEVPALKAILSAAIEARATDAGTAQRTGENP